ncbi:MAG: hypothetical protein AB7M12_09475 [Hyphomonadaceae bacterium]
MKHALIATVACAALAACGTMTSDRAISGAAIGAGVGVVGGLAGMAIGGLVGAGVGAAVPASSLDLGQPFWRRGDQGRVLVDAYGNPRPAAYNQYDGGQGSIVADGYGYRHVSFTNNCTVYYDSRGVRQSYAGPCADYQVLRADQAIAAAPAPIAPTPAPVVAAPTPAPAATPVAVAPYALPATTAATYQATGQINCALPANPMIRRCGFGVMRAGRGRGTVDVSLPDGLRRTLIFVDGRVTAADGSAVTSYRDNNQTVVTVSGSERYDIPDIVLNGE